ncbi:MAG: UDP-N-acetylmuramoyl-tripeptide--D-alanyl-D-alanine ligase [Candidatus Omnitrophica bacterium]|nr:UDP-N-acetylmuramoyl-tripeptide--D-alanyl-D-alanine ligase [Candidatus Omnitrophota bacterium]
MFSINELTKITEGKIFCRRDFGHGRVTGISIDSRTIKKGELFIAIPGEKYDGHDFTAAAIKKGAAGAVISSKKIGYIKKKIGCSFNPENDVFFIAVNDTLKMLGRLAHFHREKFDIPAIAVTGSNGKTTTKEMIAAVLGNGWAPLKNSGTQNNLVGVPLTLLRLTDANQSLVAELGMNAEGEIRQLAGIVRPNIGVITNVGPSHLQYLGDLNGVYRAKKELLDFLSRGDIALLNGDDRLLGRFKRKDLKVFRFGVGKDADFRAEDIKREDFGWSFNAAGASYSLRLPAYHDIYNALAAISVGTLFNVPSGRMREALAEYVSLDKRMVRGIIEGIEFIDDTYNSNPLSMRSAIATLSDYNAKGSRILISGDMLELGKKAADYHSEIGELVAESGIDKFISVGKLARNSFIAAKKKGMRDIWFCKTKEEAASILRKVTKPNDVVLVKGSRGMRMEEVIRCFTISYTR